MIYLQGVGITDSAIQYHLPYDNCIDCGVPNVKGQASQEAGVRNGRCGEFFRSYDATRYGEMIRDCMNERKSPMCVCDGTSWVQDGMALSVSDPLGHLAHAVNPQNALCRQ